MTNTEAAHPHAGHSTAASERVFADILCAVDGTPRSLAAVEQASILAGAHGQLTLLAVTALTGGGVYRYAAIAPARAKLILERAARIAEAAHVPCTEVIDPEDPPADVILERATEHDLLAMGAPSSSRLGGMLIGGVALDALKGFATPLLLARPTPPGSRFPERILVASDATEESDELVELVGRLARAHGAGVVLLHALGAGSRADSHRVEQQSHRLDLATDGSCELREVAGAAQEIIVETAEKVGASLVMMGSRRRRGLRAIGSVSARVVHDAPCSVLLIPPDAGR